MSQDVTPALCPKPGGRKYSSHSPDIGTPTPADRPSRSFAAWNLVFVSFEVAHGGRQPAGYGFFKSGGAHASSPSHNLLPRLVSASARIQQEDSQGTTRQDQREEVKLQQTSMIFSHCH